MVTIATKGNSDYLCTFFTIKKLFNKKIYYPFEQKYFLCNMGNQRRKNQHQIEFLNKINAKKSISDKILNLKKN